MRSDGAWINLRKLAAIDLAFGPKVIIAEFAAGALLCGALGILVLIQRDSVTELVLGVYLIGLSANYVRMLIYAIGITTNKSTRAEWGQELTDKPWVIAKYRRQVSSPVFIAFGSFSSSDAGSQSEGQEA